MATQNRRSIKRDTGLRIALPLLPTLLLTLGLAPTPASANIVGADTQNFNPTEDGLDFVTVQSSKVLDPGVVNFGAFWNYATDTLPITGGQNGAYHDSLMSIDLNAAIGILPNWELGVSLPSVIDQYVNDPTGAGLSYGSTGFTEIKFNTKYRVWHDEVQGVALIASTNISLIQNDPYEGNPAHPDLNLEAAYSRAFGPVTWGVNAGYRWRNPGAQIPGVPIVPMHDQWIASTAANYLIKDIDTKVVAEVFGATPANPSADPEPRQEKSLEALLGLKHDFTQNIAAHAGIGREIVEGVASPQFRIYVGVNIALGPLWGHSSKLEVVHSPTPEIVQDETSEIVQDGDHFRANNLNFKFNSTELESDAHETLDELVSFLNKAPFKRLVIEGHTDSVGRASYNQALSEFRAQAIRKILIEEHGVSPRKVSAIGYGASRPIADNGNYQGRLRNRRVEFKIIR